jgi:hypothetical protein
MANKFGQEIRDIYRQHGWPNSFRRDECREALKQWYMDENR